MRQEVVEYLPWGLSALSLAMSYLTGNKWKNVWLFGLFIQCLWLLWVMASQLWGFLPLTASLFVVYMRNHLKWAREASIIAMTDQITALAESIKAPYRKELWRDGKLIASVPMSSVADAQAQEPKGVFQTQECRRQPTSWWVRDPWTPDLQSVWTGAKLYDHNGNARTAVFNKYGHEASCSLMFPSTLNTEDDHCDCAARFIPKRTT